MGTFAAQFKIRCSAIGSIMGRIGLTHKQYWRMIYLIRRRSGRAFSKATGKQEGPLTLKQREELMELLAKNNRPPLPQGLKSYCETWLKEQLYDRTQEFTGKQTEKGNATEGDVIDLAGRVLIEPFLEKNQEPERVGEYIRGTCDVHVPDEMVIDVKSSYDCFSFPLFGDKAFRDYYFQLQGYGHLYSVPKLVLFYGLVDMTPDQILKEAHYEARKRGTVIDEHIHQEVVDRHTYSHLPDFLRVRYWVFKSDPIFIEEVIRRVKLCRKHIAELEAKLPLMKYEDLTMQELNAICLAGNS